MHTVTQQELADYLDISARMVRYLLEEGVFHKEANGKLDKDKCRIAYIRHLREQAAGRKSEHTEYDLIGERARLAKAQADKTELEVGTLQGKLLLAEDVLKEWQKLLAACKAKLMAIPTKCALQIVSLQEPTEIERFLKRMIYEALTELSRYEPDIVSNGDSGSENTGTTARTDSKPVGRQKPKIKSRGKRRTRKVANG